MSRQNLKWNDISGIIKFYWDQKFVKFGFWFWLSVMIGSPFVLGIVDVVYNGGAFQLNWDGTKLFGFIAVIVLPIFYFARNNE